MKKSKHLCDCGGQMRPARLTNVDLRPYFGVFAVAAKADGERCDHCDFAVLTAPTITALRHQLVGLVLETPERLPPAYLYFLRVYLGLYQAELAKRMGITRKTVVQWETKGGISPQHDYILRMLAYAKLESAYRPEIPDRVRTAAAKIRRPPLVLKAA